MSKLSELLALRELYTVHLNLLRKRLEEAYAKEQDAAGIEHEVFMAGLRLASLHRKIRKIEAESA